MPARRNIVSLSGIAVLVALSDQLSKAAIIAWIGPGSTRSSVPVVPGWVELTYIENRGVAFGLLPDVGLALVAIAIAILVGLLGRYMRTDAPSIWETIGTGAIVGGAAGNIIDRIRLGYVVDYISVGGWPNFNLADSAISVGVVCLLLGWVAGNPELRIAESS